MLTGAWNNFERLEEDLSYLELVALVKALHDKEYRELRALMAAQGIDIESNSDAEKTPENDIVERKKAEAKAKRLGKDIDDVVLEDWAVAAGFTVKNG